MRPAALALLLTTLAGPALAHGDAAFWIMQDRETRGCCGPQDCVPIETPVLYSPDGWRFRHPMRDGVVVFAPLDGTRRHPSIDHQYWACFYINSIGKPLRCLFTPNTGV